MRFSTMNTHNWNKLLVQFLLANLKTLIIYLTKKNVTQILYFEKKIIFILVHMNDYE